MLVRREWPASTGVRWAFGSGVSDFNLWRYVSLAYPGQEASKKRPDEKQAAKSPGR